VQITEKMKRFYADICAADGSLQARPKVFESVSVDIALNVLFRMIDDVMDVLLTKVAVRAKRIAIDGRSCFDVLYNFTVKMPPLRALNNHRADFPVTLKQTHHGNLTRGLVASGARRRKLRNASSQSGLVHVPSLAADKSF